MSQGEYGPRIGDIERRLLIVEASSHRGEYRMIVGSSQPSLKPGEMWARATNTHVSWMEIATMWAAHHIDASGTTHPLWMVPDDGDPDGFNPPWLFGVETLAGDEIIGSAFYQIVDGSATNTNTVLSWTVDILRAEGTPPQTGDTVRAIFTPMTGGGSGDVTDPGYTDAEIDALLAGKLNKGSSTAIQLNNGSTIEQSTFSKTGHTHSGYASSSHTHSGYASSSHTHNYASSGHSHSSYISKTDSNKKILQADGTIGPVKFTKSGTALYWE